MKTLLTSATLLLAASTVALADGHLPLETVDQEATTSVTIPVVKMSVNGFVAIHGSDENGEMIAPASLGHAYVEAGNHSDVVVNLATAVSSGTALYAMLHIDDGKEEVYEFGTDQTEFDGPYIHDDAPVIVKFMVK